MNLRGKITLTFTLWVGLEACIQNAGLSSTEKADSIQVALRAKLLVDSIQNAQEASNDPVVLNEQEKAIGDIKFNVSEKTFNKGRDVYLTKCKLKDFEYFMNATFIYYKIGEYGFGQMDGWFHKDSLYAIKLTGCRVNYDDYDRVMPSQYKALMGLLRAKYGEPKFESGLPNWTALENGYYKVAATWNIGTKTIEARVSARETKYTLDLEVYLPAVLRRIENEKEQGSDSSVRKGLEVL